MRHTLFITVACGVLSLLPCTSHADDLQSQLRKYNALKLSDDAQLFPPAANYTDAYADYAFECRKEADFLPKESAAAQEAFQRFVDDVRSHPDPSPDDKRRRNALIERAMAAGSWQARFFNAMWTLRLERGTPEVQKQFKVLIDMAQQGNPAALGAYLTRASNLEEDDAQRVTIQKAAIDRGNPAVMASVGFHLGTRTHELRPKGVAMLKCAASQGEGRGYDGLATIAWLEGRWVDAYRLWAAGANLDCESCMTHVEDIVMTRPDYRPSDGTYGKEPTVAALRRFYGSQMLYTISHLKALRIDAPSEMQFKLTDEQIVALIETRIRTYGLP